MKMKQAGIVKEAMQEQCMAMSKAFLQNAVSKYIT